MRGYIHIKMNYCKKIFIWLWVICLLWIAYGLIRFAAFGSRSIDECTHKWKNDFSSAYWIDDQLIRLRLYLEHNNLLSLIKIFCKTNEET